MKDSKELFSVLDTAFSLDSEAGDVLMSHHLKDMADLVEAVGEYFLFQFEEDAGMPMNKMATQYLLKAIHEVRGAAHTLMIAQLEQDRSK